MLVPTVRSPLTVPPLASVRPAGSVYPPGGADTSNIPAAATLIGPVAPTVPLPLSASVPALACVGPW